MIKPFPLSYDDCWLKAERFLIDGLTREALYYYEEAYLIAKRDGYISKKQEATLKISKILVSFNNYFYSKLLYNFLFYSLSLKMTFSCNSSSACCTKFRVDIDIYDLIRILDNNSNLKKEDFIVDYDKNKYFKDDINNLDLKNSNNEKLTLKKQFGKQDCIFLKDFLCSINDYKPLVCRNWPMIIDEIGQVVFSHYNSNFIKKNCNYTISKETNIKSDYYIKKSLKEFNYNNYYTMFLYKKISKYYSFSFDKDFDAKTFKDWSITFTQYLNLIENYIREKNIIVNDISEYIKLNIDVNFIKLIFFENYEGIYDINLLIKNTKPITDEEIKIFSLLLKDYNILSIYDGVLHLEKDNFYLEIEFNITNSFNHIEKIIYGEEDFSENKNIIDLNLDEEIVYQLLKASISILKFLRKNKDVNKNEILDVFKNISILKDKFYNFDSLSYLFDFIYLNEIILNNKDQEYIFDFIKECSDKYPLKSLVFELEKINLIPEKDQLDKYINNLIVKNKNNLKNIKKIFIFLRHNNEIDYNDIFYINILVELSNQLINTNDLSSIIKILENKIKNIYLCNNSYPLFYNLSISYLRLGRYKDSLVIIEQLKNKFPRNLELLLSIGDELYSEELYQEAVEYLNLSLEMITYKSNPQEFNIICEILLEIFINKNQISKAKKILSLWKKSNVKEVDKIVSISLFEIKLLTSKEKDRLLNNLFDKKNISYLEFYILNKINNKFITLPLDISVLKNKLLNTKVNAKLNKEITIKIFNKIHELFYLSAKSTILDKILKLKEDFKILFLKYFIYEELKDYNSASICLDKIDSYYDTFILKDNEINLIILLLRAFIKEFSLDYKASLELYSSIFKLDLKPEYIDIVNTLHSNILLKLQFDKKEFNLLQKEITLLIKSLEKNNNQQTILH